MNGPWYVKQSRMNLNYFIYSDPTCLSDHRVGAARLEADAHLMAAAPPLLLALEEAILRVELANSEGDPILSAWLPDAKRAVAKAKRE